MFKYFLLTSLVFSLLIAVIFSIEALKAPETDTSDSTALSKQNISIMQGVRVVSTRNGQMVWSLNSPQIQVVDTYVRLFGVDAQLNASPDESGTISRVKIVAPSGQYQTYTGGLTLSGGVTMSGQGFTMTTESVEFDSDSRIFSTDDRVVFDGEGFRLQGDGLQAQGQSVRILSNAKAFYY